MSTHEPVPLAPAPRHPTLRRTAAIAAAVGIAVGIAAGAALTPQPEPAPPGAPPAEAADLPGEPHAMLTSLAGEWETLSTFSMDGVPDADAVPGHARVESIMDGHFIAIHETDAMFGEQMSSMKLYGYNNAAAVYEATWVYTGSTAMMRARGVGDPVTGVLTFQAQYASGPEQNERFIITLAAPGWNGDAQAAAEPPDRFTITLVALLPDGTAGPKLETSYTRAP